MKKSCYQDITLIYFVLDVDKIITYLIHMNNLHFKIYNQLAAHKYLMKKIGFTEMHLDPNFVANIQIKALFPPH